MKPALRPLALMITCLIAAAGLIRGQLRRQGIE